MPIAELLPVIPNPPHDPRFFRLNAQAGWRTSEPNDANISAGEVIALATPASAARSFDEPSGSMGGLTEPHRVAAAGNGVLLWDERSGRLKQLDPCQCVFRPVPCVRMRAASMVVCGKNLYVADADARKVRVIDLGSFALRDEWAPPKGATGNPWRPVSIAVDSRRRFYVADADNAVIHRFRGTGEWEAMFTAGGTPVRVAVNAEDRVVVVRDSQPGALLLDAEGTLIRTLASPAEVAATFATPIPTDREGRFDAGAFCEGGGSRWFTPQGDVFLRNGPIVPSYAESGTWIAGPLDSRISGCVWHRVALRGLVLPGTSVRVSTLTADALLPEGHLTLPEVQWREHPAKLTRLREGAWDCLIPSPAGRYLWLRLDLTGNSTTTPAIYEAVVEYPRISLRRYLPGVFGEQQIAADFTDRFLAVFDTTLRSIERQVDMQARLFDPLSSPSEIDPKTGIDFLSWLASWVGISLDRQWPERKRREWLKRAGEFFCLRGTREGLRRQLVLLLGMEQMERACCRDPWLPGTCRPVPACVPCPPKRAWDAPPLILEHFQVRRWLHLGCGKLGDQSELWGQSIVNRSQLNENAQVGGTQLVTSKDPYRDPFHVQAHRFSVFVPACWGATPAARRSLLNLLEMEKPAHTQAQLEFVEPRFRIGVQASIGLNSVVGRYPAGYRLGEPLGRSSLLSPTGGRPVRIGTTTDLN